MSVRKRRLGYVFALLAIFIFSMQDGISKHLGQSYPPVFITMIRYWAFAGFSVLLASRLRGGLRATAKTNAPWLQVTRGALLAIEIVMAITCFAIIGLARTQAIFAATPLIATLLSIIVLGERAGLIRWLAVLLGFAGVLVVIRPSGDFFEPVVLLAVLTSLMFAVYIVLTRLVSRVDPPMTSFFYTGVAGCVTISLIGPFFWTNLPPGDWAWMLLLCLTSVSSHYFLIKAYDILDASAVQPLTYLSIVNASIMGTLLFDETITSTTFAGAVIIVSAGLMSIWSERRSSQQE
ncbi:MAG TPA: DMT family transporter [Aestuariivirga sp.]|nr:DMT family transporter [Aestuariivirga sp.]